MAIMWKDELPDGMMGSSDTMNFTLDSSGEWEDSKTYDTVGTTVDVSGTITGPAGYVWNIKVSSSQGWSKEYDNVPTGQKESFSIKTNFGSTKITIKVYSVNRDAPLALRGNKNEKITVDSFVYTLSCASRKVSDLHRAICFLRCITRSTNR